MDNKEIWGWEDVEKVRDFLMDPFRAEDGSLIVPVEVTKHDDGDGQGIYFLVKVHLTERLLREVTGKNKRLKTKAEIREEQE